MTRSEPGRSTYSSRREAVSWTYEMLAAADRPRAVRIRDAVLAVRAAAGRVGAVEAIRWSTEEAGEHAVVQAGDAADVVGPQTGAGDDGVFGALVEITLHVDEPDGGTTAHAAGLAVHVASEDDGSVFVVVRLRTGAYADTTPDGDNRPVAALNRDRLRSFLSTLRNSLGLRLDDLEPGYYRGQVDGAGFLAGPQEPATAPGAAHARAAGLVGAALTLTEERLATAPQGPVRAMFGSIREQLVFMRDLVDDGRVPTAPERNRLSLGVIAVREFESTDLPYCEAICEAVFAFESL